MEPSLAASVPKHPIPHGDGFWVIRANHRAFRELEDLEARRTGVRRSFSAILATPDGSLSFYQDLLWAMSATHRDRLSETGKVDFLAFLDILPQAGDEWQKLVTTALEMCVNFWPRSEVAEHIEDDEGNQSPAPSEPDPPTGSGDSTLPLSSAE